MNDASIPDRDRIVNLLQDRSNWGRWGDGDQRGAVNLITSRKVAEATRLVKSGRTVSLSRPFPTEPAPHNPRPAMHHVRTIARPEGGGAAVDHYGITYHGLACTHLDALCHAWDDDGMWGGRDPAEEITPDGVRWGGVEHWASGITTRGVLLDVPRFRGTSTITPSQPVHGEELEAIAASQGVDVGQGDALVVFSGRGAWEADHPTWPPPKWLDPEPVRPGLHASCLAYLREHDVSVLVWDLMDAHPSGYDALAWTVHAALFKFGVALVDNAQLEPLAEACALEQRYEFLLVIAPLRVPGGTGSPVNPIAIF